jgi:hypothetical protein
VHSQDVSILLQRVSTAPAEEEDVRVGFLFPELVASVLRLGVDSLVMEGPKVVARGVVTEVWAGPGDTGEADP